MRLPPSPLLSSPLSLSLILSLSLPLTPADVGHMQMFYKACHIEYEPLGVVGTIVPWNYPFHNIFNPLLAAVFAGNAIVIKVSEHASWSARYYQAIIDAALSAAAAPAGLVRIITGVLLLEAPLPRTHFITNLPCLLRQQRTTSMQARQRRGARSCAAAATSSSLSAPRPSAAPSCGTPLTPSLP